MKLYKDKLFNFTEIFNEKNGMLIRTNILDENGKETTVEPKMRSFPVLWENVMLIKNFVKVLE